MHCKITENNGKTKISYSSNIMQHKLQARMFTQTEKSTHLPLPSDGIFV
jgi:hypothetical protein